MFVYNGCEADARVLKEAATLVRAGHHVQIVAILVKGTEPREPRDGFEIVRVDRQPVHYRLLRRARLVRRWLRLRTARIKRFFRNRRRRLERRWRGMRNRHRRRPKAATDPEARPATRSRLRGPIALLGLPARLYRAARWRILRRFPAARRFYYRRRASRRRLYGRLRYRYRRAAQRGSVWAPRALSEALPARLAWLLLAAVIAPIKGISRLPRLIDGSVSHVAYRFVMILHKPLLYLEYYRRAHRLVLEGHWDVLHAHDLNTLPVAVWAGRSIGAQVVYDAHELYPEVSTLSRRERFIWRRLEPRLIRRVDEVLTVCESIASELTRRYRVAQPRVLLNCPERALMRRGQRSGVLRAKVGLDDDRPIVLYSGGFARFRGLEQLIEAGRYVTRGVIVLMGWGVLEKELAEQIERHGLGDRVRLTEPVEREEILTYTSDADVGVIPYQPVGLNNTYTTPNKLFDYAAAGVAVAGSRLPELRRFVEGYGFGVTFDPYDPRDQALAINYLLEDAERLASMRANALIAAEELVWERQVGSLLEIYDGAKLPHEQPALPSPVA